MKCRLHLTALFQVLQVLVILCSCATTLMFKANACACARVTVVECVRKLCSQKIAAPSPREPITERMLCPDLTSFIHCALPACLYVSLLKRAHPQPTTPLPSLGQNRRSDRTESISSAV